jgi:hypothetical protein
MSPIFNVDKGGSVAGRTVFDASAGKNSLNGGADRERCDEDIPAVPSPSLLDLCNMACDARKKYGRSRRLTGATVDRKPAYEQYFHTEDIPLLFGTQVDLEDDEGESHRVVVAWIGGCFGFTRGGFAYGETKIQQLITTITFVVHFSIDMFHLHFESQFRFNFEIFEIDYSRTKPG